MTDIEFPNLKKKNIHNDTLSVVSFNASLSSVDSSPAHNASFTSQNIFGHLMKIPQPKHMMR